VSRTNVVFFGSEVGVSEGKVMSLSYYENVIDISYRPRTKGSVEERAAMPWKGTMKMQTGQNHNFPFLPVVPKLAVGRITSKRLKIKTWTILWQDLYIGVDRVQNGQSGLRK
jgi:hypothetical protein